MAVKLGLSPKGKNVECVENILT